MSRICLSAYGWLGGGLLQVLLCLPLFAQATVTGRVTEAQTGKPLPGVNVFLSDTMRGTATDSLGQYTLRNIPPGSYELVASMVGFQAQTEAISLRNSQHLPIDFVLKETTYSLSAIEVTGAFPKDWKKNYEHFKRLFLSTTKNAAKCEILNPFVLDFTVHPERHTFRAKASAPLIVENHALGYRLQVLLLAFEENSHLNTLHYVVKTQFEEMAPENERQRVQFEKNRETTYRGSSRHFFKALASQRTEIEGFEVVGKAAFFSRRMLRTVPEGKLKANDAYPIDPDTLLAQTRTGEPLLIFDDFLGVRYLREREPIGYLRFMRAAHRFNTQLTLLDVRRPVTIDARGSLSDPMAVITYGYWFWQRIADMLPLEYEPPSTNGDSSF